jgi:hypothetical protein
MCGDLDPAYACPLCRDGNECYCGASCAAADVKHLALCIANQPAEEGVGGEKGEAEEEEAQQPGRTGARGGGRPWRFCECARKQGGRRRGGGRTV